jgi:2-hydroxyacyl-CoA lyase 1
MTASWKPPASAGAGFGGKGFFVEDPKHIRGALDEAMNHRGPALVNIVLSQGSAGKPQQFRWHS